ncbi:MAG TPA: hypothetical protein VG222_05720, partial [Vicinamibacterales bacterium]|nr:hypothetical protein [Vicinamibacterales bacterium]
MKTDSDTSRSKRRAAGAGQAPSVSAGQVRESFLSLVSRPGSGATTAMFFGSNRVGDALLSTGIGKIAGSAVAMMSALLPVGLAGLDIHEPLHRLDANVHLPTLERGVSSANRVGEPICLLSMKWRLAPDGFVATPSAMPPDTEIHQGSSQRFVMQEGSVTFQDRGQGAIRFFGAGRTYPATTDGHARLLFAGTAVVFEGTGSLKGARGTLMISGEVTSPSSVALTVVGRFDAGSPVATEDTLGPLFDLTGPDAPATIITLLGESQAGGWERVRVARVGNDVANAARLRSLFRVGAPVGRADGPLPFDASDLRCAVELKGASRTITFTDPAGRRIGSIVAANLEGTAFPDVRGGGTVNRLSAYGPATHGAGALTGAGGVLMIDSAVDEHGATRTLYILRLSDPGGRFRASFADVYKPMPASKRDAPTESAPMETL